MILTKKQTGFTVVETLIVIGVTSFMFVSMSSLITGQIANNQYRSSMQLMQNTIQQQVNSVSSGFFTEQSNCDGSPIVNVNELGKSNDCVIIGKRITLQKSNNGTDNGHPTTLRVDVLGANPANLPANSVDIAVLGTQYVNLPTNIEYKKYINNDTPGDTLPINAIYSSALDNSINATSGSGSQTVKLLNSDFSPLIPNNIIDTGIIACFTDGKRSGSIVYGLKNSYFVTLNIVDNRCE